MKYQFIEDRRSESRVTKMCRAMRVLRSGYYDWRGCCESRRSIDNRVLLTHIRIVHKQSRATYGSPRMRVKLNESGLACGEIRVARLMRENGIRAKRMGKFRATTNSKHSYPSIPNLLNRRFEVTTPNTVWVSDIT